MNVNDITLAAKFAFWSWNKLDESSRDQVMPEIATKSWAVPSTKDAFQQPSLCKAEQDRL